MPDLYDIDVQSIDGSSHKLNEYAGRILLVVNVASQCGFTPQYRELEALYRKHRDRGLVVLGFPCNQFRKQEPGNSSEIRQFCSNTYDISFPIFSKIQVNGDGTHPLYRRLKSAAKGILGTQAIKWNFTKFLVNREGRVIRRFAPFTKPADLEKDVIALLS